MTQKYDYSSISADGQSWINDLKSAAPESAFPELEPSDMTEIERDILASYLCCDDGSLSAESLEFSAAVGAEIEALCPINLEA